MPQQGVSSIAQSDRQTSGKQDKKWDNQQVQLGGCGFFLRNSEPRTVNSSDFALFHRDTFQQRTDTERAASDAVAKSLEEKTDRLVETLSANTQKLATLVDLVTAILANNIKSDEETENNGGNNRGDNDEEIEENESQVMCGNGTIITKQMMNNDNDDDEETEKNGGNDDCSNDDVETEDNDKKVFEALPLCADRVLGGNINGNHNRKKAPTKTAAPSNEGSNVVTVEGGYNVELTALVWISERHATKEGRRLLKVGIG